MKTTIATYKQSLFDITLQNDGTAESAIDIALKNSLSLSENITAGQEITINDTATNPQMAKYYSVNTLQPATALDENRAILGGISYMGIAIDFIVS